MPSAKITKERSNRRMPQQVSNLLEEEEIVIGVYQESIQTLLPKQIVQVDQLLTVFTSTRRKSSYSGDLDPKRYSEVRSSDPPHHPQVRELFQCAKINPVMFQVVLTANNDVLD